MVINPFASRARYEALRRHGDRLLRELLNPENGFGGHLTLITGPIGRGKTSILLAFAKAFAKKGFIVLARGREAFEFYRLPKWKDLVELWAPADHSIKFREYNGGERLLNLPVNRYDDIDDLLEKVKKRPGKIHVVFYSKKINESWLKERESEKLIQEQAKSCRETIFWAEFFDKAIKKLAGRRTVIAIDEAHELWPSGSSGLLWHQINFTKSRIADFRRFKLNLVMTTHVHNDIDWRVIQKLDYAVYLRGAKVLGRAVKQRFTYKLDDKHCYIEDPAEYGLIPLKKLKETRTILVTWKYEGHMLKERELKERTEKHLKAIYEVAEENDGLFQRRFVKERLGRDFNKDAYLAAVKCLKKKGNVKEVGRGVYWLST